MNTVTTRSRTNLFRSYRDSRSRHNHYSDDDEHEGLIRSNNHVAINAQLAPAWYVSVMFTPAASLMALGRL